jgi:hypothetical protein
VIKQRPIAEKPAADRTGFFLVVTIIAAVTATVVARNFTAQFLSYLPGEPRGWENVRAHLVALDLATQSFRIFGGLFVGMLGVKFFTVAAAPLTELSVLVGCLVSFWRKKNRVGVFAMLFWLGFSFINFAYYTADTKVGAITIIGGMSRCDGGAHGWDFMITGLGLADHSVGLGKNMFFAGCWLMSFGALAGIIALAEAVARFFSKDS